MKPTEYRILTERGPNGELWVHGDDKFEAAIKCLGTKHQIYKMIEYALKEADATPKSVPNK
jgi:hypothetical protein